VRKLVIKSEAVCTDRAHLVRKDETLRLKLIDGVPEKLRLRRGVSGEIPDFEESCGVVERRITFDQIGDSPRKTAESRRTDRVQRLLRIASEGSCNGGACLRRYCQYFRRQVVRARPRQSSSASQIREPFSR